jgi:hypothetical protein
LLWEQAEGTTIASLGHLDPAGCGNSHTAPRQVAIAVPPKEKPRSAESGAMYRAMTSAVKGPTRAISHRAAASP